MVEVVQKHNMTYGEAHVAEINSLTMIKGEFVQTLIVNNKPKPMPKDDAIRYYNTKLFAYWMDQLDDRLSILRKKQIVSALMFGHVHTYKKIKEIK